jgi:NhaP-type Na+/H+ or K+/H+ antiporter
MPLTIVLVALAAKFIVGFDWPTSFLLGAILSPTDPVFASALVGRREVPRALRDLLNVESGLNDGLALPAVWVTLSLVSGENSHWAQALMELAAGAAIGVMIPLLAIWLESLDRFRAVGLYQTMRGLAIGLVIFGLCGITGANAFIAAFVAGVTVAAVSLEVKADYCKFGETSSELLKLAGVMGFATLLSPQFLVNMSVAGYLFALVVLIVVRPLATGPALLGSGLSWPAAGAAVWFGPKGFASLFYALFALQSKAPGMEQVFHLVAIVVAISMIAHSSSDVPIVGWLSPSQPKPVDPALQQSRA